MNIESGLFPHMVLQRDAGNVSRAQVTGGCHGAGDVLATVAKRDRGVLDDWADRPVGAAAAGSFAAQIDGLPVGGNESVRCRAQGGFIESGHESVLYPESAQF